MTFNFSENKCLLIAGPCSAESREQVWNTALKVSVGGKVHAFRAGVWKPRTRPGGFEGMGAKALPWLKSVQEKLHLPVCIEVAKPAHIQQALKYGINFFWIGARTTANPFSVQELAEALKGVDCAVMVKNPIHPDLQLWIGALERMMRSGIKQLAAVHRGFHIASGSTFRNTPLWQIPIELKVQFPHIPVICDPSHISGRRDLIYDVSQNALDLGMNGLMIETHFKPRMALSDRNQQLDPEALFAVIDKLRVKVHSSGDPTFNKKLKGLRDKIDRLDRDMMRILLKRCSLVQNIAKEKRKTGVTAFQLQRWVAILKSRTLWAEKMHLMPDFISKLYQLVHEESIRIQIESMNSDSGKRGIKK